MDGLNFEDLKLENITNPNYQAKGNDEEDSKSKAEDKVKDTADDAGSKSGDKSDAQKFNEKIEKQVEKTEKVDKVEKETKSTKKEKEEVEEEEEEAERTDSEEEVEEHDLDLSPIYNRLIEELGLDIKLEDMELDPHKEEDLPEFLKAIVAENSKPTYASSEVAEFDKFVKNGGDPRKFLETMYAPTDYEKINIDKATDSVKRKVVYDLYQTKYPNKDSEWIEKKIDRMENSGTLDDEAKDALDELVDLDKERKVNIVKEQEQHKAQQQKQYEDYVTDFKKSITEAKEFGGIPVSDKDKEAMLKYSLIQDRKTGKTEYQKKLEDKEHQMALLFFSMKGFSFDDIKKTVKTEVTKDLKKNLSKYSTKQSSGSHVRANDPTKGEGEVDYSVLRKFLGK